MGDYIYKVSTRPAAHLDDGTPVYRPLYAYKPSFRGGSDSARQHVVSGAAACERAWAKLGNPTGVRLAFLPELPAEPTPEQLAEQEPAVPVLVRVSPTSGVELPATGTFLDGGVAFRTVGYLRRLVTGTGRVRWVECSRQLYEVLQASWRQGRERERQARIAARVADEWAACAARFVA